MSDRSLCLDQPLDAAGNALDGADVTPGRDRQFILRQPRDRVENENVTHVAGRTDVALESADGRVHVADVARETHRGAEVSEWRPNVTDVILCPQVAGELALARLHVADRAGVGLRQEGGSERVGVDVRDVPEGCLQAEQGRPVDEHVGEAAVPIIFHRVAREANRAGVSARDVQRVGEPIGAELLLDVARDAQGADLPGDLRGISHREAEMQMAGRVDEAAERAGKIDREILGGVAGGDLAGDRGHSDGADAVGVDARS